MVTASIGVLSTAYAADELTVTLIVQTGVGLVGSIAAMYTRWLTGDLK